jgi:hypothetical protein
MGLEDSGRFDLFGLAKGMHHRHLVEAQGSRLKAHGAYWLVCVETDQTAEEQEHEQCAPRTRNARSVAIRPLNEPAVDPPRLALYNYP